MRVRADLDAGKVVVITGFQGVDDSGNITTLGRGGSDTSAVAVAAAMKITYDLLLWVAFRHLKPPEETAAART